MAKKNFYAVQNGRKTGIFKTWDECKQQVNGFKNARYKGFKTLEQAQEYLGNNIGNAEEGMQIAQPPPPPRIEIIPPRAEKKGMDGTSASMLSVAKRQRDTVEGGTKSNGMSHLWNVLISFDGGSRGNPGVAGSGAEIIVVERDAAGVQKARTKIHLREYLGTDSTNNEAEWQGAQSGLVQVVDHVQRFLDKVPNHEHNIHEVTINMVVQGDSQLVIRQLQGRYQCNKPALKLIKDKFDHTFKKLKGMVSKLTVRYQHVYRNDNAVADRLANEAMDAKDTWVTRTEDREEESVGDKPPAKKTKVYADV